MFPFSPSLAESMFSFLISLPLHQVGAAKLDLH